MNRPIVLAGIKEKQPTALRFAADAANARRGKLRVLHSLDVRLAGDFVSGPHDYWRAAGESVLEDAKDVVRELNPRPPADYALDIRPPFQMLSEEAVSAALVVVGVDAPGWFGQLFGGSVTQRLTAHVSAPVAVVPERPWPGEATGPVFVAIDARSPATGPLRFAFSEASRRASPLHVAHVIPAEDIYHRSASHNAAVSEILAGWREEFPDVRITHRFFFDEAGEGCVRVSEEASVLVLGRRRTQILGHPVLAQIASRTHCPTVVVADDWKEGS